MASKKTADFLKYIKDFQVEDLQSIADDLKLLEREALSDDHKEQYRIIQTIIKKVEESGDLKDGIREVIHDIVKDSYEDDKVFDKRESKRLKPADNTAKKERKREEIYRILESLPRQTDSKNINEATAAFSSMLDIVRQFCSLKSDGIISVRTRLDEIFNIDKKTLRTNPELKQEVVLFFAPEEVEAMRMKLSSMPENDPTKPLIIMVLDEAYDIVQFNEITGNLLFIMTQYFMDELLSVQGVSRKDIREFEERFERYQDSFEAIVKEMGQHEKVIKSHMFDRPILRELPNYMRALIRIKIGLLDSEHKPKVVSKLKTGINEYGRARNAVALDFNRLPQLHLNLRLRQNSILGLQRDVLQSMDDVLEKEYKDSKTELEGMMAEIEANSKKLNPGSKEFAALLKQKELIQQRLEESRRRIDVIRSQRRMVDVQQAIMNDSLRRFQSANADIVSKTEIKSFHKIDTKKKTPKEKKASTHRMVHVEKLKRR